MLSSAVCVVQLPCRAAIFPSLFSAVSQKGLKLLAVPSSSRRVTPALSFVSGHAQAALLRKEGVPLKGQINMASSDSEVEIVGVQEKAR